MGMIKESLFLCRMITVQDYLWFVKPPKKGYDLIMQHKELVRAQIEFEETETVPYAGLKFEGDVQGFSFQL